MEWPRNFLHHGMTADICAPTVCGIPSCALTVKKIPMGWPSWPGCLMCMYACKSRQACKTREVLGHAPPGNFLKLDALRLLLRSFWNRSRAVVATWLAEYCIEFLALQVCICMLSQLTTNFHERRY